MPSRGEDKVLCGRASTGRGVIARISKRPDGLTVCYSQGDPKGLDCSVLLHHFKRGSKRLLKRLNWMVGEPVRKCQQKKGFAISRPLAMRVVLVGDMRFKILSAARPIANLTVMHE